MGPWCTPPVLRNSFARIFWAGTDLVVIHALLGPHSITDDVHLQACSTERIGKKKGFSTLDGFPLEKRKPASRAENHALTQHYGSPARLDVAAILRGTVRRDRARIQVYRKQRRLM